MLLQLRVVQFCSKVMVGVQVLGVHCPAKAWPAARPNILAFESCVLSRARGSSRRLSSEIAGPWPKPPEGRAEYVWMAAPCDLYKPPQTDQQICLRLKTSEVFPTAARAECSISWGALKDFCRL